MSVRVHDTRARDLDPGETPEQTHHDYRGLDEEDGKQEMPGDRCLEYRRVVVPRRESSSLSRNQRWRAAKDN
jgi:hypothetical protein